VRRARRQAYHAEGRDRRRGPVTLDGLAADEARLAALLADAAAQAGSPSDLADLARETRAAAAPSPPGEAVRPGDEAADILALAERLADDYLEIGDRSGDEAVVARAQALGERAVLRLARLRALGDALPGDGRAG
jgi:hypothetical protein